MNTLGELLDTRVTNNVCQHHLRMPIAANRHRGYRGGLGGKRNRSEKELRVLVELVPPKKRIAITAKEKDSKCRLPSQCDCGVLIVLAENEDALYDVRTTART